MGHSKNFSLRLTPIIFSMADNDEVNVTDSDSPQFESVESQISQIYRLSDIAMKRYLEADKL